MTLRPSRDEFRALARDHTVIPVWREVLADFTTPVAAFARLVGEDPGFLLESVEHGERWSRWSFIGRNPLATLTARGRQVETSGALPPGMPLDQLIAKTASVKYARTSAVQSGYTPTGTYKVTTPGETEKISRLLAHQEQRNPARIDEHQALLDKYGFTRKTRMLMRFDITFEVRPK